MRVMIFQLDAFTTRRLVEDRVELEGACVFYMEGEAEI